MAAHSPDNERIKRTPARPEVAELSPARRASGASAAMTPTVSIPDILGRLQGVRRARDGWSARCPAHEDDRPSLSISRGDRQPVLLHCHAGCTLGRSLRRLA